MKDIRQTREYANYLRKIGWVVESSRGRQGKTVYYFIKKFPLIGSFIKIQRPEKINIKTINSLAKKYRAFQIVIEPENKYQVASIKYQGFKQSKSPYLPSKTIHLDLTKSKKELFSQLKKDCRYSIRKFRNAKHKISNTNDVEKFHSCWKKSVSWQRAVLSLKDLKALKKSFGNNCLLLVTDLASSGAIFLKTKDVAYYWQAFTGKEGRKALAQYALVWEGILWAKRNKAKVFDFEGIYDERFPNKRWKGFSHFKKSFGGAEIEYLGAFVKWRLPIRSTKE